MKQSVASRAVHSSDNRTDTGTADMTTQCVQCKDKDILVPLLQSFVRPVLEYGKVVWGLQAEIIIIIIITINPLSNVKRRLSSGLLV